MLWESSRGGRELEAWAGFLNACREHRVLIHVTSHQRTYDMQVGPDWKTLAEDGVASAYESELTSERISRRAEGLNGIGPSAGVLPPSTEQGNQPSLGPLFGGLTPGASEPQVPPQFPVFQWSAEP